MIMRTCLVVLAVAACSKHPTTGDDYFGNAVAPPRGLAKIVVGMTEKEALAAVPGAKVLRPSVIAVPSGADDVELDAISDAKSDPLILGVVAHVRGTLASKIRGILTTHWGPPTSRDVWATDQWRARLSDGTGYAKIEFWPAMTPAFWGPAATLPKPIAKVKPGMMKHDIEGVVAPAVARFRRIPEDDTFVTFVGDESPGGLSSVSLFFAGDRVRGTLLKAWGEGEVQDRVTLEGKQHTWYGPDGWSAKLHEARPGEMVIDRPADDTLTFAPFQPTAKFLGPGLDVAALTPSPFGKTIEELQPSYPGLRSNVLLATPTEHTENIRVIFTLDANAKVDSAQLEMAYTKKGEVALRVAFEEKWGPPTKDGVYHATAPYVRAEDTGHAWLVTIRPTPPSGKPR